MPAPTFVSYAQNAEDVVLYRALGARPPGRYVDVGANDPLLDSVTRAFYDRGWRGIAVEPVHAFAERFRTERPGDLVVEAVILDTPADEVVLHQFLGTGWSTVDDQVAADHRASGRQPVDLAVPARRLDDVLSEAGWSPDEPIELMVVDVEGAELSVLSSIDLHRWRPWVLVVEATRPTSPEPNYADWDAILVASDYTFTLFDGLSRFYVAAEHAAEFGAALAVPANRFDRYVTVTGENEKVAVAELADQIEPAHAERERALAELAVTELAVASDQEQDQAALAEAIAAAVMWREQLNQPPPPQPTIEPPAPGEVAMLRANIETYTAEIAAIKATVSWRVSAPLRRGQGRLSNRLRRALR